ncbi:MAG: multiheme c-type cytochrome [Pirellulaceae bacterium]
MKTSWMIVSLLSLNMLAVVASTWSLHAESPSVASVPAKLAAKIPRASSNNGYVTSETCKSCHANAHATWHASYHRTMTRPATPENVLGRFDGTEIVSRGLKYRVFREGDEFWVEMPDPEIMMYTVQGGKRIEPSVYLVKRSADSPVERLDLRTIPRVKRHVIMTTGSHHYQTYWVEGDAKFGRLIQTLPLVYLIKDDRWIPRQDAFMIPPDSPPFITQWNHHCIRCHSTGGNPNLVASDGGKPTAEDHVFETEAAELGIACEACHGPGEKHVQMQLDLKNGVAETSSELDLQIVNPAKLDHRRSSQICGQCHGVFVMNDDEARRYASHGSSLSPRRRSGGNSLLHSLPQREIRRLNAKRICNGIKRCSASVGGTMGPSWLAVANTPPSWKPSVFSTVRCHVFRATKCMVQIQWISSSPTCVPTWPARSATTNRSTPAKFPVTRTTRKRPVVVNA